MVRGESQIRGDFFPFLEVGFIEGAAESGERVGDDGIETAQLGGAGGGGVDFELLEGPVF